jgi:predicted metal-binding protein
MSSPGATIFVCVTCRRATEAMPEAFEQPGRALADRLADEIATTGATELIVEPVECLAVCKRPCTIALVGDDKWTYLIGDLDNSSHVSEIVQAAQAFARSENGIVPWKERPQTFRKGVIARVPPLGFKQPEPETTAT